MPQLRVVSFNSTTIDSQRLSMFLFCAAQGAALSVHVWRHSGWPEMLTEPECLHIAAEVAIFRGSDAPTLAWHTPDDKDEGGRYAANELRVQ
jgi:hypothetical protein